MALAYCSIWSRFSSSSSSSMSSAPPENMSSEEDGVDVDDAARFVIERAGVVNAYVWEIAAAHAAMVRADVFMVVSVFLWWLNSPIAIGSIDCKGQPTH